LKLRNTPLKGIVEHGCILRAFTQMTSCYNPAQRGGGGGGVIEIGMMIGKRSERSLTALLLFLLSKGHKHFPA